MNKFRILLAVMLFALVSCEDDKTEIVGPPINGGIELARKEMRAIWIATVGNIDWPSTKNNVEAQKKEYIDYLDKFKDYNINTVIVQVRPMADAFYDSSLEPWSAYLTGTQGQNPGYDVLQFMLDEAHARGLEFHAWLNPYRIASDVNTFKPAASHIYNTHPEWTMTYNKLLIFRPALPEVRAFFLDVVKDLISKYDVDGIHFDDYFYPYPVTGLELSDQDDYQKYGAEYKTIEDFRRGNVNKVIEEVHNLIKTERPDVLFSVSPYAVWRNITDDPAGSSTTGLSNYDGLYADVKLWCEKGWLDFVVPQLYASTENAAANFKHLAKWWPEHSYETPVLIGYPLYKFGVEAEGQIFMNPVELEAQFFYAYHQKASVKDKIKGSVLYNASTFKTNRINILDIVKKVYSTPALRPFMGRHTLPNPVKISDLRISAGLLSWNAGEPDNYYAVYKIEEKTGTLIAVVADNSYQLDEHGTYIVTVINGDNVESEISELVTYE